MPVLLSGIFQTDHVAAGEMLKQRYYRNINNLRICRQVLLSGNFQCHNVAAGEYDQTTILSEH